MDISGHSGLEPEPEQAQATWDAAAPAAPAGPAPATPAPATPAPATPAPVTPAPVTPALVTPLPSPPPPSPPPATPAPTGPAPAGPPGGGEPPPPGNGLDGPEPRTAEERVNKTIIVFLGVALLAVVGGLIALALLHKGMTLPDGLTSLASLIAGGLLAFLNPLSKRPAKGNKSEPGA
jgi:hypothetical protein